ncbi:MAG: UPF0149 family protein [Methyloglobulus sp.]|nr:UPF0149 family protein [Methyloglobulus sp.]
MHYQHIDTIVANHDAELSAAEAHGMAAGMLCVNDRTELRFWLQELLNDADAINDEDRSILENLFEDTRSLLASDEFVFGLLLPADDYPLGEQVEALRKWCQGFLFGLGSTSSTSGSTPNWPEEIREVVKDITEFTKLDTEPEDEEAENDFMELTEYLRAAVIFLRSELNSADNRTVH